MMGLSRKEGSSGPSLNRETVEELMRAVSEKAEIKPVFRIGEHIKTLFPKL